LIGQVVVLLLMILVVPEIPGIGTGSVRDVVAIAEPEIQDAEIRVDPEVANVSHAAGIDEASAVATVTRIVVVVVIEMEWKKNWKARSTTE